MNAKCKAGIVSVNYLKYSNAYLGRNKMFPVGLEKIESLARQIKNIIEDNFLKIDKYKSITI